jgi:PRC-barrel domain
MALFLLAAGLVSSPFATCGRRCRNPVKCPRLAALIAGSRASLPQISPPAPSILPLLTLVATEPARSRPVLVVIGPPEARMQTTTRTGTGSVATDETNRLIASNKVEGTAVYNRQGDRLGSIYNFMVDKRSGQAEYAVMSFGGFLGIGDDYYPLPWKSLTYDSSLGGYVVDLDKDRLRGAPSYASSETPDWSDPSYGRRVDDYYGSLAGHLDRP